MNPLTARQQQVREIILSWYYTHDYYATLGDIAQEMGLKTRSTVHQHIQNLIRYRYLQKAEGKQAYEIPQRELDYFKTHHLVNEGLPLHERIAAGKPIGAIENPNTINPNDLLLALEDTR